ncbi:hypothetical protein ACJX0J_019993 [Zea mays]
MNYLEKREDIRGISQKDLEKHNKILKNYSKKEDELNRGLDAIRSAKVTTKSHRTFVLECGCNNNGDGKNQYGDTLDTILKDDKGKNFHGSLKNYFTICFHNAKAAQKNNFKALRKMLNILENDLEKDIALAAEKAQDDKISKLEKYKGEA